jgi:hypothetical protein
LEDELGRVCSAHGGDEKYKQNFGYKPEGKRPVARLGITEMIILKWIIRK